MSALRKVPGFDLLLRKVIGFVGERGLRYLYLGSSVRVGPKQFPIIDRVFTECLETLDIKERPELYVSQTPHVNAGAIGVDKPFIVLNSATVQLLTEEELRFVLGHELGHVLSDHVLYKTMFHLLLRFGVGAAIIPFGGLALAAVLAALGEWHRKSEISCDRSGLLCTQDAPVAYGTLMKLAGGGASSQTNVEAFLEQAHEYEAGGTVVDGVFKFLNLIGSEHPLHALRVLEMKRFFEGDNYAQILAGNYATRDKDPHHKIYDEVKESARSYQKAYSDSKDPLVSFVRELGTGVADSASTVWSELKKSFSGGKEWPKKEWPEEQKSNDDAKS
jgi:Zn-dependent protease with chaperone function